MGFLKKTLGTLKTGAAVLMKSKTLAVMALCLAAFSSFAEGTVTLPETGVDIAGYATAAITAIGTVCGVVVAGVIAFIVVRKGIKWIRSIG